MSDEFGVADAEALAALRSSSPHPTPVDPAEVREVLAKPGRFTAGDGTDVDVIEVGDRYELYVTQKHGSSVTQQAAVHVTPELASWLAEHVRPLASLSAPVPPEPQLSDEDRERVTDYLRHCLVHGEEATLDEDDCAVILEAMG